jgi:hypothetical protein
MPIETRTLLVGSCLALLAAGCGGGYAGPTAPSGPAASGIAAPIVGGEQLIPIPGNVRGTSATIADQGQSRGKVSICHVTGNGSYHPIVVGVSAEPAHKAHGDGKIGDPVPADPTKVFDSECQPAGGLVDLVD